MQKIYLPVVTDYREGIDSVFSGSMPVFSGTEDENLACGSCKAVLAKGVSTRTFYERFVTDTDRLIIECACGAMCAVRTPPPDALQR